MANLPVSNLTTPLPIFTPAGRTPTGLTAFRGRGNVEKNIHPGFGPPYLPVTFLKNNYSQDASRIDPTWNPGYAYGAKGMLAYLSAGGGGGGGGTTGYPI